MKYMQKRMAWVIAAAMVSACVVLGACSSNSQPSTETDDTSASTADASFDMAQWKEAFPNQYYSYRDSVYSEYPVEGTGHAGSLWDVQHVGNWSAGCGACHSSQHEALVEELGAEYLNVNTVSPGRYERAKITEDDLKALDDNAFNRFDARAINDVGITCYQCHGDTPGTLVIANSWIVEAAEKGGYDMDNPDLVCAQCHSIPDYSSILTNADSSTWFMLQYGTDPDAVYDGFLEKGVPNPSFSNEGLEFDQFYGSVMDKAGANCYDCHTGTAMDEDGNEYTEHAFLDPGTNRELYENCSSCHNDSAEERYNAVQNVQEDYRTRAAAALEQVESLKAALDAATGTKGQDVIDKATALYYRAQFYYDYGRETAEGVHSMGNGTTETCFDKAAVTAQEGAALLS